MYKRLLKIIITVSLTLILNTCATKGPANKTEVTSKSWFSTQNRKQEADQDSESVIILKEDSAISDKYWWYNFHDQILNDLIAIALEQNLDLKIAKNRINQSRSEVTSARSVMLPGVSANANVSQGNTFSPQATQKTANNKSLESDFTVSWEIDFFGRSRSYLAAAKSRMKAKIATAKAVEIAITAEVAKDYINLRNSQAQLKIATKNLEFEEKKFELTSIKNKYGLISGLEKTQAKSKLEIIRSNIPLLKDATERNIRALELLLGKNTGDLENKLSADSLSYDQLIPNIDEKVIINCKAQVIRNRPDVIAAEAELSAAMSLEDAAIASFYPRISLLGLFGYQTNGEGLFNADNSIRSAGASLTLPIFDFGRLRSSLKSARTYKEEALLEYQKSLLTAVAEIENNLSSYLSAKESYQSLIIASNNDKKTLEITNKLYQKGATELSEKIDAEISFNQQQSNLLQNQTEMAIKMILLYKSLGSIN